GMPEEMVRLANEKSQQIRHAYERIKTARGMR
ncbi:MAG TPA: molecular chaperone DjlA, partial [Gammaproteobacteria bacterium]